jgi:hypothetical protein
MQQVEDWKKVFPARKQATLDLLQTEQTTTFTTLSILLSNHGSDWIDQSLGGGLTFVEFSRLGPQVVNDYIKDFEKFYKIKGMKTTKRVRSVQSEESLGGCWPKRQSLPWRIKRGQGFTFHIEEPKLEEKNITDMREVVGRLNAMLKARVKYDDST